MEQGGLKFVPALEMYYATTTWGDSSARLLDDSSEKTPRIPRA